jgi:predicted DNA-binding protein with PD1-like motif
MKHKLVNDQNNQRVFVLIYEAGDTFQKPLLSFAAEKKLGASQFYAIGAFRSAMLGYFDRERKDYLKLPVNEQAEVLTLSGNITGDDEPKLHVHAILGLRDASVRGGHLFDGEIWPTLELILTESPQHLKRRFDPEFGLALIDI